MEELEKLKLKIKIVLLCIFIMNNKMCYSIYSYWHEEQDKEIEKELKSIDEMWWLSRRKKDELKKEVERKKENKKLEERKIKWIYDEKDKEKFAKDKFEIIDEDNDGIGYKYYFDNNGYLLFDTITKDYNIVNKNGREIDKEFNEVEYIIEKKNMLNEEIKENLAEEKKETVSQIILDKGVDLDKDEKIFDKNIDKNMLNHIEISNKFIKKTSGMIHNEVLWRNCSLLNSKDGYIEINNPKNNFNRVKFYISKEYTTYIETDKRVHLRVYDAVEYEKYKENNILENIEEIYRYNDIEGRVKIDFIFDRSIERLRFDIETEGEEETNTKIYMKDLEYGFNKTAFREEVERKKEEEKEIEELKRLGIYVDEIWKFELVDEEGIEIEEEEDEEEEEKGDVIEETKSYEDKIRDRNTGPAFDSELQKNRTWRDSGPAFEEIN